jgi:hypothetical protein
MDSSVNAAIIEHLFGQRNNPRDVLLPSRRDATFPRPRRVEAAGPLGTPQPRQWPRTLTWGAERCHAGQVPNYEEGTFRTRVGWRLAER